jgi:hypothetical protein
MDIHFSFTYTFCFYLLTTLARPTMPRKPKTTETAPETAPEAVETKPVEAAPEAPRGSKTAAIKAALRANRDKLPKELAELMNAQGWDVTAQRISVVKSAMKAEKKAKKAAPAPEPEVAFEVPKDAVSIGLLVKAKKLVKELGGVQEAKAALNALAQLLD